MTLRTLFAYCLAPLGHSFAAVRPNRQPLAVPKASPGFTVIELVTALVIAGVLGTLAVPRYHSTVVNARRGEAKANLSHIASLQSVYRIEHDFSPFSGLSVGYVSTDAESCANNVANKGLRNALGFRPEGCDSLRYGYTTDSSGNAEAYGPSDAPDRWIYPDCPGSSVGTQCGQTQGDVVRIAANATKADVCRDIIEFCPGGGTVTPCPTSCSCGCDPPGVCKSPCCPSCTPGTVWDSPPDTSNTCTYDTVPRTGRVTSCVGSPCPTPSPSPTSTPVPGTKPCPCPSGNSCGTCGTCLTDGVTCNEPITCCSPACPATQKCVGTTCEDKTCAELGITSCSNCETLNTNQPCCTGGCTAPKTLCDTIPDPDVCECPSCFDTTHIQDPNTCACTSPCSDPNETACTDGTTTICCNTATQTCDTTGVTPVCNDLCSVTCTASCHSCDSNGNCVNDCSSTQICDTTGLTPVCCTDTNPADGVCDIVCSNGLPQSDCSTAGGTWDGLVSPPSCRCSCNDVTCNADRKRKSSLPASNFTEANCCEDKTCAADFPASSCSQGKVLNTTGTPYPGGCCVDCPACQVPNAAGDQCVGCPAGKVPDAAGDTCVDCPDCEACNTTTNTCEGLTPVNEGVVVDCQPVGTNPQCCPKDHNANTLTCTAGNKCCPADPADLPGFLETCTTACGCAATGTDTDGNQIELECVADDDDSTVGTCGAVETCSEIEPGRYCNNYPDISESAAYTPSNVPGDPCCREKSTDAADNQLECLSASGSILSDGEVATGHCCNTRAGTGESCQVLGQLQWAVKGCCASNLRCKDMSGASDAPGSNNICCPYPFPDADGAECTNICGCGGTHTCEEDKTDTTKKVCCPYPLPNRGKPCTNICGCLGSPKCKDTVGINHADDYKCCLDPLPETIGAICVSACGCGKIAGTNKSLRCNLTDGPQNSGVCCPLDSNDLPPNSEGTACHYSCGCKQGYRCTGGTCVYVPACTGVAEGINCIKGGSHPSGILNYPCCRDELPNTTCQTTSFGDEECCTSLRAEGSTCSLAVGTGCCEQNLSCIGDSGGNPVCQARGFMASLPNFPLKPIKCFSHRLAPNILGVINACAKDTSGLKNLGYKNGVSIPSGGTYLDSFHSCGIIESIFDPDNYWLSSKKQASNGSVTVTYRCREALLAVFGAYNSNIGNSLDTMSGHTFVVSDVDSSSTTITIGGDNLVSPTLDAGSNSCACQGVGGGSCATNECDPDTP